MDRQGDLVAQKRHKERCAKQRFEGDISRNKSNIKPGRRIEPAGGWGRV